MSKIGTLSSRTLSMAGLRALGREQVCSSPASDASIRVSELLSSLSYALDLTEGREMGHSVRSCILGMRIAQEIGLLEADLADLYYTLLLKDAGCSSNSSRLLTSSTPTICAQKAI